MNAVATLLFSPDYLPGALVLGHALRKIVDKNTKLVILIDLAAFNPLHLHLLRQLWDDVRDTKVYSSQLHHKLVNDLQRPELASTYTKIQLWDLPYEKVLYLDADTLPLIGANSNVTDLLKLDFPVGKILAAPDSGFPDIFNSGVFALRPNQTDYLNLLSLVMSNNKDISFDGADQGLLNQYFNANPDWVSQLLDNKESNVYAGQLCQSSNWVKIPFLYNTTPNTQYQYAPAFNHFQNPTPEQHIPGVNDGTQPDYGSGKISSEHSSSIASAAYHATAFNHFTSFQPGNQVKLIHFIGPVKPWKSESAGLFGNWWKEWYEYSGGKLMYETLYRQFYTITVTPLRIPGQDIEDITYYHEDPVSASQTAATVDLPVYVPEKKILAPADLCDPMNYQQFASEPPVSHSTWDATREQPPLEKPKLSNFDADIRAFNSSWEDHSSQEPEAAPEKHHQPPNEFAEPSKQETIEEFVSGSSPLIVGHEEHELTNQPVESEQHESEKEFGYHRDQKPERSFDDSHDYMPTHYLLEKQKEAESAAQAQEITEMAAEMELDEEEEEFVEENVEDEIVVPDDLPEDEPIQDHGFAKLFPWEFREARATTRSWD